MAYTKPQLRKKEEGKRLRGEGDQIKYIDLRFERWQVLGLTAKQEEDKKVHKLHVLGMNHGFWDRFHEEGAVKLGKGVNEWRVRGEEA